jgi:membrane fusion protein, multidrug efflux system
MKKSKLKIFIPLLLVSAAVLIGCIYWYIDYLKYIKTDDAIVLSDAVTVSPKIMGRINKVYVQEGDSVKQGQLLAELDSTDLLAQKRQIETGKLQTQANKEQAIAKYEYDQKNSEVLHVALQRAKDDFERAKAQYAGGVITKEQYDHLQKSMESAQVQYAASLAQVQVSKTQIKSTETAITTSQAQIEVVKTQLMNTRLVAPVDGVVSKRWLLAGDIANAGQAIFTLNNQSKYWVMVYLEETNMAQLHLGQAAIFTLDTYSDVVFSGKIFMLGSSTASQFSLIPASNASGNFTKVTQRVPIKISIDGVNAGKELSDYRLMSGMSAIVKIVR